MSLRRIFAVFLRHYYGSKHQIERLADIFVFPIMGLLLWGFLTQYVSGLQGSLVTSFLIGGLILWVVFERVSTEIGVAFMFDIWERNITYFLASPLKFKEYLLSAVALSIFKIFISILVMAIIAWVFYGFKITEFGFGLILFWTNLIIFAAALGIFNVSLVLRFGNSIGPLTWILPIILQPISAIFYPLSTLPPVFQTIAHFIPISYVFEGMRQVLSGDGFNFGGFWMALTLSLIYFTLAVGFFNFVFKVVKQKGRLVKF